MSARRRVAVATGTRAEFGLLRTVMRAVRTHPGLELTTIVAGAHWLAPAETWREVEAAFGIDARVPMQRDGEVGRLADARALGRGVEGFAAALEALRPAWVLVLGDRVEAFAAAAAASVAGVGVAHMHGGDRAEGVADEAMRHAITKLAHLHLPATPASADRIVRMGEPPDRVRVVGSPAIDGLSDIPPMDEREHAALGAPDTVLLLHPVGSAPEREAATASAALEALAGRRVLAMAPNFDPGREGIGGAIARSGVRALDHLPRDRWIGLLRRVAAAGGVLVGNSSAGLIEASAIDPPLRAVNIGPRQAGRERAGNSVDAAGESAEAVRAALGAALSLDLRGLRHPYGDGRAGERAAEALAAIDPAGLIRKRNAY